MNSKAQPSNPEIPSSGRIFVSAGEASGDLHTANLIRELQKAGNYELEGFGGERMANVGVRIHYDLPKMALIGFVEVAKHLPTVFKLLRFVRRHWSKNRPDAVLLTDFPGLHLRMAKIAAEMGIPVIYYISPQLWAWHESRVEQIRNLIRRMIVILPFEVEFYARHEIEVFYAGHPLLDHVPPKCEKQLDTSNVRIGLLPGSRPGEIKKILPVMRDAAVQLHNRYPDYEFILPLAATLDMQILERFALPSWIQVIRDEDYSARQNLNLAWTASGTATIENAILDIPMAILYRSNALNIFLARRLIRIPYIGLANLIAGQGVCPEFLQEQCRVDALLGWTEEFLLSPERQQSMREGLARIRDRLGQPGASQRAANEVHRLLANGPVES